MRRLRLNRAALAALGAVGMASSSWSCGGDPATRSLAPVAEWGGDVADEDGGFVVDFGVVPVGSKALRTVALANKGTLPLTVTPTAASRPFGMDLPAGGLSVPVGGRVEIRFDFLPEEPSDGPSETYVVLTTNGKAGDEERRFHLVGRGAAPNIDCTPSKVEFGPVLTGKSKKARTVCSNLADVGTMIQLGGFTGRSKDRFKAQILDPGAIPDEPFDVGAHGTVEIEITFTAGTAAGDETYVTALPIWDGTGFNQLAQIDATAISVRTALALEPKGCLDFGSIAEGASKELPFTLWNFGEEPAVVDEVSVDVRAAAEVIVTTPRPITVAPGESELVVVRYTPVIGGKRTATLTFHASDGTSEGATLTGCATVFAGGPQLDCTPEAIDFGKVALEMSASRSLRCTYAGHAPPGQPVDPLIIDDVYTDTSVFQANKATIRNSDGSTGARPDGYLVEESFVIDVVYAPTMEGVDSGKVTIESAAAPGGALRVPVSGRGLHLPPCRFDLRPASLEFGVVDAGKTRRLSFTFENTLAAGSCLINDLRISADSDKAFSVTPIDTMELGAGAVLEVPVTFAPTRYQPDITGEVRFQISNRDEPLQRVPVRGTAARACLEFVPPAVDFGKVAPGCRSRDRSVVIRNLCPGSASITDVSIDETRSSHAFSVGRKPSLPWVVGFRDQGEMGMIFAPTDLGRHASVLRVVTTAGVYLVDLEGVADGDPIQTDSFDGPPYTLRGNPADRNGDGAVNEKDFSVTVNGTPTSSVSGTGSRVWAYTTSDYEIFFQFGAWGPVTVTYNLACLR